MCVNHGEASNLWKHLNLILYIVGIGLGVLVGLSEIVWLHHLGEQVTNIFIKLFKFISLPIISLSIIVTFSQFSSSDKTMSSAWKRTLFYTVTTTIVAATIACGLYVLIAPENMHLANADSARVNLGNGYMHYLGDIVPSNILSPFVEHHIMGVLLISVVVGISLRYINDEGGRDAVKNFFKGSHGIFMVITSWVIKIIPIGLFGFIVTTILQVKKDGQSVGVIWKYLLVIFLANILQGFVVLPAWLKVNGFVPFKTMKQMMPALSLAFFSKTSTGTLPVTMRVIEENVGVNPKISRFILPLCTTVNMNGCAAFIFTTVIYLMQNNGTAIDASLLLIWIFISTIAAIGNAGVPMGCFFLSASLLASMDVPITLMAIILPFYSVIDMVETALNVWSDSCVAITVDHKEKSS